MRAPREVSASTPRRGIPDPEPAELQAYRLTASVLQLRVSAMGLDGGGQPVKTIMPGRDDSQASSGGRGGRAVALTFEGRPRTELMAPELLTGLDGRRISGKLQSICIVASRLPRELLVDLVLENKENPLREMAGMDDAKAAAFASAVVQRAGESRHSENALTDIHRWRGMVAHFESRYGSEPGLARQPSLPLEGWDGARGFRAVRRLGNNDFQYLRADGSWVTGSAAYNGIGAPASAVEQILGKLPVDVVVDLHETYPGDPLREVLAMGPEKAAAFAAFLSGHFGEVKTMVSWIMAMRHFEAHWQEGTCYSNGLDEGEKTAWVGRAIDQIYRRTTAAATLQNWAAGMKESLLRISAADITAADVAAFASSPAVLKETRVESVSMVGSNVRIVLREPIVPRMIAMGGRTWREADDQVGKVMKANPIAAFDLLYSGEAGSFPNALAYADKACTQQASHPNINNGRVCMGELSDRGAHASSSTLNDFLRMMMLWNLDSAYYKDAGSLMVRPASKPADWEGDPILWPYWQPGLVRIEMGFKPLPFVSMEGSAMGTVEEVLD